MYIILLKLILIQSPSRTYFKLLRSSKILDNLRIIYKKIKPPRKYAKKFTFSLFKGEVDEKLVLSSINKTIYAGDIIIVIKSYLVYQIYKYIFDGNRLIQFDEFLQIPEILSNYPFDYWYQIEKYSYETDVYLSLSSNFKKCINKSIKSNNIKINGYIFDTFYKCFEVEYQKELYWVVVYQNQKNKIFRSYYPNIQSYFNRVLTVQ